jgi:N-acetylglucosamine-6-phosphate deacetylase
VSRTELMGRDARTGHPIIVTVEKDLILSIDPTDRPSDTWISAGLVDLQVNGYFGLDLNGVDHTGRDPSADTVSKLTRIMLTTGVTTFVPTIITAPETEILQRLVAISNAHAIDPVVAACIPYIHVEGPSISPRAGFRGAHPHDSVRPPSLAEFDRWQEASGGMVGLVTLSPHFPASAEYIRALVERGVHVSLGHTHATHEEIKNAVEAGASLSTHLGNGIALKLDRHPNPIWSQLADDRLSACFIADGHHLPAEALKAMMRATGDLDRLILVSDSVALAGMPPGNYKAPVGGRVELSIDGRLSMKGTSTLAGAAMPLITCIGRAAKMTGRPLSEVLAMATKNPGRFTGHRGQLIVGGRADILRFHWNEKESAATVRDVWLGGKLEHEAP